MSFAIRFFSGVKPPPPVKTKEPASLQRLFAECVKPPEQRPAVADDESLSMICLASEKGLPV